MWCDRRLVDGALVPNPVPLESNTNKRELFRRGADIDLGRRDAEIQQQRAVDEEEENTPGHLGDMIRQVCCKPVKEGRLRCLRALPWNRFSYYSCFWIWSNFFRLLGCVGKKSTQLMWKCGLHEFFFNRDCCHNTAFWYLVFCTYDHCSDFTTWVSLSRDLSIACYLSGTQPVGCNTSI